jgi:AbiJ N-terminal domain 4/Restriction endonuclease
MEKFSHRMGIQHVDTALQIDSMEVGLRNALWNVFVDRVRWGMASYYAQKFGEQIWKYCFDKLLDEVPSRDVDKVFKAIKERYFTLKWYEVYDFVEFVANHLDRDDTTKFVEACNSVLKDHLSAYRFVGKKLVPATNRELLFLNLIHDLLQNLGYRVVTEPIVQDIQLDLLAYYPVTAPDGTPSEQAWVVEVKYRNLAGKLGIATLHQIYEYSKKLKASKALLVTNLTLSKEAQFFVTKNNELEIWDVNKLLALLKRFPELSQKYSDVIPQLDTAIDEEEPTDKTLDGQHELIRELRSLPTGDGKAYEGQVKRILEFCLCDEFRPFSVKDQVYTYNKKRIRDFIIDNRNPKVEFWQGLKYVRKVEKILFDAKNYKNPVEYREILDTLRYLTNEAFGNFIIIISRHGIKDYEEVLEDYSSKNEVALFISDDDLVKMINLKIEGNSPTLLIEDKYFDFLDKK